MKLTGFYETGEIRSLEHRKNSKILSISVLVQNLARGDIESPPGSVHGVSDLLLVGLDVAHTMKLAGFYETGEIQGLEHR